jgi:hypothetical protein
VLPVFGRRSSASADTGWKSAVGIKRQSSLQPNVQLPNRASPHAPDINGIDNATSLIVEGRWLERLKKVSHRGHGGHGGGQTDVACRFGAHRNQSFFRRPSPPYDRSDLAAPPRCSQFHFLRDLRDLRARPSPIRSKDHNEGRDHVCRWLRTTRNTKAARYKTYGINDTLNRSQRTASDGLQSVDPI